LKIIYLSGFAILVGDAMEFKDLCDVTSSDALFSNHKETGQKNDANEFSCRELRWGEMMIELEPLS
jgi:hypothetical protein